jgi:antitoxin VapB
MATLNIHDPELHEPARQLAARTGETITEAVKKALAERLERTSADIEQRRRRILETAAEFRRLRVDDPRSPDEIIGCNEHGHFD